MGAQLFLVERAVVGDLNDARDRLPPFVIGHTYDERVVDVGMGLQCFLDFLRVDLLARGVDADAAATEQCERPVRLDLTPVTRDRIALAVDDRECPGGLFRIFVVAGRNAACLGDEARHTAAGQHLLVVLREHLDVGTQSELCHLGASVLRCRRGADAHCFGCTEGVHQHEPVMVTQEARFDFGAPHHARRDDVPQAAEVETAGLLVEYLQQRFAEGVADDRHDVHLVAFDDRPGINRVEPGRVGRDDDTAVGQRGQRDEESGAVHLWAGGVGAAAPAFRCDVCSVFFGACRGRFAVGRAGDALAVGKPVVLVFPHDPFWHTGRAAGIEEDHVVASAFDVEFAAVAVIG